MQVFNLIPENLFQALSDSTRFRIIRLMVVSGQEICLCELVDALREPQYNLSRHLKLLRQSGILTSYKQGRWLYHCLNNEPGFNALYNLIHSFSDPKGTYQTDYKYFTQRMSLRENGRCQVGVLKKKPASSKL